MERRRFLASTFVASVLAASPRVLTQAGPEAGDENAREFYELRHYMLSAGPQRKLTDDYFRDALVPALNRLGFSPAGVFNVTIGPDMPAMVVLIPSLSVERLVTLDDRLKKDAEYTKAAANFLNAPAKEPAFKRIESSLMQAFEKMPRLTLPTASALHSPRVFEVRTYEGASDLDHARKIEQMSSGEVDIFTKAGIPQVFYGDTLIGQRLPNLTYMICFDSLAERDKKWSEFFNSAAWKVLSADPRFNFESIVSNTTNLMLAPTPYSQI
ncbi:MAG: NIPSNAP family protein [Candidatus Acidiferrales bacterium]|jgi:hypothetical protein